MTTTRSKTVAGEVEHLVDICLTNKPTTSGLKEALAEFHVTGVPDLLALPTSKISSLEYTGDDGVKKVPEWATQALIQLKSFVYFQRSEGNTDYFSYTYDEYGDYLVDSYNSEHPHGAPSPASRSPAPGSKASGPYVRPPAEDFKKSNKRSKTDYKPFKEDKEWDSWHRSTLATARFHGCEDVLDPKYKPKTAEEKDLFDEKQKFLYSVFEEYLLTDMGKRCVRQYSKTYDAQAVYRDLEKHAKKSTQACLTSSELLTFLTTYTLHNSDWRGTSHSFILNWCDKLRKYEALIHEDDYFTGTVKRTMLENAVRGVSDLNQVKVKDAHDVAHGKRPLNYGAYLNLLLSTATTYDAAQGLTRNRSKRFVSNHEMETEPEDPYPEVSYDIDTDLGSLEINNTDSRPKGRRAFRPSMKKEQWNFLSVEEQELWDKLSPQSKAVILGYRQPTPNVPQASNSTTKVNLHGISAADYIAMVHSQTSPDDEDTSEPIFYDSNENPEETPPNPPNEDLLTYVTKQSLPQGDVRKVLSSVGTSPTKDPPLKRPPRDKNQTDVSFASTVTINGKTYRQVNVHERKQYNVSKHKASTKGSLIDRGANGGLAGSDVRIVHKAAVPRYVDVSGIDSHQVTDLPIVTVGGVVPSQRGDVIAIMHQYAYMGEGKTIHSSCQLEHFKNDVNDKSLKVS